MAEMERGVCVSFVLLVNGNKCEQPNTADNFRTHTHLFKRLSPGIYYFFFVISAHAYLLIDLRTQFRFHENFNILNVIEKKIDFFDNSIIANGTKRKCKYKYTKSQFFNILVRFELFDLSPVKC